MKKNPQSLVKNAWLFVFNSSTCLGWCNVSDPCITKCGHTVIYGILFTMCFAMTTCAWPYKRSDVELSDCNRWTTVGNTGVSGYV